MKRRIAEPTKEVSDRMKKVRRRGTVIEAEMKHILDGLNLGYDEQPRIDGVRSTPDFKIKGTRVLIFCDSSFWHGRRAKELSGDAFNRNRAFWSKKLKENRERDRRNTRRLRKEGWAVLRFWDTDILSNPNRIKNELRKIASERRAPSYSAVDLFCGAGAITHGLIKAGIPVNAGIDNDESCRYAYEKNNESRFIKRDIRRLSHQCVEAMFPKDDIKILVGCAPCQPFSKFTQKNKQRVKDEKWRLLYSFSRLIKDIRPHVVSMENVTEISKQKVFSDFVNLLKLLQYHVSWKFVFCPDYGIPQSRKRLVLLASRLGEIELMPKTHTPSRYKTVRQAIGKLEAIRAGGESKKDHLHRAAGLSPTNMKRIEQSKPGGTWMDWDKGLRARCHTENTGSSFTGVYSRMEWDKPSPTITTQFYTYGTGRFGHPEQDRALSLREGALLQTFPKKYDFIDPDNGIIIKRIGKHIGNAVPVKLGEIIGKSIKRHIEVHGEVKN